MMNVPENLVDNIDYRISLNIEKYHTQAALDMGVPDEVLNLPGNVLTNKGINLIWKLVSDTPLKWDVDDRYERAFDGAHSFIGVGNIDGRDTPPPAGDPTQATSGDTMLWAEENYDPSLAQGEGATRQQCHYCYMGMNTTYPLAGDNQKIVFQSTFLPGVACFNWFEWCIANGNGNQKTEDMKKDAYIVRETAWGTAQGNDIDDVAPDPVPTAGTSYVGAEEADRQKKTLLNRRVESMGRKYASATWIITVEVSLS